MKRVLYLAHVLHQEELLKKRSRLNNDEVHSKDTEETESDEEENGDGTSVPSLPETDISNESIANPIPQNESSVQRLARITMEKYKEAVGNQVIMEYIDESMKSNWSFDPHRKEVSVDPDVYLYSKIDAPEPVKEKLRTLKKLRGKHNHQNLVSRQKFLNHADDLREELERMRTPIPDPKKGKRIFKILEG